jgi:hypothetical protein
MTASVVLPGRAVFLQSRLTDALGVCPLERIETFPISARQKERLEDFYNLTYIFRMRPAFVTWPA